MLNILRLRPEQPRPGYTQSHLTKGEDYARNFTDLACRAHIWELEQSVIERWLGDLSPATVLDFATGTGRIAALVSRTLPKSRVVGVDISAAMLSVARKAAPKAEFVQVDGRQAIDRFRPFDLVTAFRFFPNAEPELRRSAAEQIASLVKPGGHLIVNNHRGFWSPSYVAQRLRPGGHAKGMLNSQMVALLKPLGFRLVETASLGLWPQSERKPYLMPLGLWRRLEAFNARRLAGAHRLGYDTLFLFRRTA